MYKKCIHFKHAFLHNMSLKSSLFKHYSLLTSIIFTFQAKSQQQFRAVVRAVSFPFQTHLGIASAEKVYISCHTKRISGYLYSYFSFSYLKNFSYFYPTDIIQVFCAKSVPNILCNFLFLPPKNDTLA